MSAKTEALKEKSDYALRFMKKRLHPKGVPFYVLLTTIFALGIIFSSSLVASYQLRAELPEEFVRARSSAAKVSKTIVDLTSSANERIRKISIEDVERQAPGAIDEITIARQENRWAGAHASDLSEELQTMTESLVGIPSANTQRLAYEAIATELSLVSEFLVYTQGLDEFLRTLQEAYDGGMTSERREDIQIKLDKVNTSTKAINELNREFLSKMKRFDRSF